MMRTYSGHSSAEASNALYRSNLAKGQTGLSVAFDLPTQTGYDPDHELARGEVGKVGVPVAHKGDMAMLMDGIPLGEMNTSMTINATAAWLLALYIVTAEEHGVDPSALQGTTQNDIIKEFLARGTYAFPPGPSMRLIADMVAYTVEHVPRWNPVNICSYHLQEAGATPVQEIAYSLANAIAVLDAVRERVGDEGIARVFGRISFFVNAGVRFVEEHAGVDEERDPPEDADALRRPTRSRTAWHRRSHSRASRHLLDRVAARLLQVVRAVHRVPARDVLDGVRDHVGDQPHRQGQAGTRRSRGRGTP